MKGSLKRVVRRQRRVQAALLLCEQGQVGVEPRSEPVVLVKTIQQNEEGIHWKCRSSIVNQVSSQGLAAHPAEPKTQSYEHAHRDQIHSCGQAGQQVETKR